MREVWVRTESEQCWCCECWSWDQSPRQFPAALSSSPAQGGGDGGGVSRDRRRWRERTKSAPFSPSPQQTSGLLSHGKNLILRDKNEQEFTENFGR